MAAKRLVLITLLALAAACAPATPAPTTTPVPSATPAATAKPSVETIEGRFDVGGYSLYIKCEGAAGAAPTIVYLHGWSERNNSASSASAVSLPSRLRDHYRFCAYDRINIGYSDNRPEVNSGTEAVRDLHTLLERADVPPPYVLLGASFGGLLAYEYLKTYPDQIVGMLLLDAGFPDELSLEQYYPEADQLVNFDWSETGEKLNGLKVYTEAMALREAVEPALPVTYLRAMPPVNWTLDVPEYDEQVLILQAAYVASFPQGVLEGVESEHWMEYGNPTAVVDALHKLMERIAAAP